MVYSHISYKYSQVTTLRLQLIGEAILLYLAESTIFTVLYKGWD
jgi:hypothetical protein